jgi:hypothetical protein
VLYSVRNTATVAIDIATRQQFAQCSKVFALMPTADTEYSEAS